MSQYNVNDQHDFLIIPRQDVKVDNSGGDHRVYIKIRDLTTLENIINQCEDIRARMLGEVIKNVD